MVAQPFTFDEPAQKKATSGSSFKTQFKLRTPNSFEFGLPSRHSPAFQLQEKKQETMLTQPFTVGEPVQKAATSSSSFKTQFNLKTPHSFYSKSASRSISAFQFQDNRPETMVHQPFTFGDPAQKAVTSRSSSKTKFNLKTPHSGDTKLVSRPKQAFRFQKKNQETVVAQPFTFGKPIQKAATSSSSSKTQFNLSTPPSFEFRLASNLFPASQSQKNKKEILVAQPFTLDEPIQKAVTPRSSFKTKFNLKTPHSADSELASRPNSAFRFQKKKQETVVAQPFNFGKPAEKAVTSSSSFKTQFNFSTPPSFEFGLASSPFTAFQFQKNKKETMAAQPFTFGEPTQKAVTSGSSFKTQSNLSTSRSLKLELSSTQPRSFQLSTSQTLAPNRKFKRATRKISEEHKLK